MSRRTIPLAALTWFATLLPLTAVAAGPAQAASVLAWNGKSGALPPPSTTLFSSALRRFSLVNVLRRRETLELPLPDARVLPILEELPLVGAVRRRAGERFNTTDSSHGSDFALCYRLSQRMALQIVPTDAMPVRSMAARKNSAGVLVGMAFRLGGR